MITLEYKDTKGPVWNMILFSTAYRAAKLLSKMNSVPRANVYSSGERGADSRSV
jgi:hypothetical protein